MAQWNTAEFIRRNAPLASFSQPGISSWLVEAYAHGKHFKAENFWPGGVNDSFYLIGVQVYGVLLNHKSKTEDFLFQSISQTNTAKTVNMNASPLTWKEVVMA